MSTTTQASFIFDSVKRNDFEQVKLFIQQNPSLLHAIDDQQNTLLHVACKYNNEKIALFVLDRLTNHAMQSSSNPTDMINQMILQENAEKLSPLSLSSPRLRGMIKASIEISKMKKLLMDKYELTAAGKTQTLSTSQSTTLTSVNTAPLLTPASESDVDSVREQTQKLYDMMSKQ